MAAQKHCDIMFLRYLLEHRDRSRLIVICESLLRNRHAIISVSAHEPKLCRGVNSQGSTELGRRDQASRYSYFSIHLDSNPFKLPKNTGNPHIIDLVCIDAFFNTRDNPSVLWTTLAHTLGALSCNLNLPVHQELSPYLCNGLGWCDLNQTSSRSWAQINEMV